MLLFRQPLLSSSHSPQLNLSLNPVFINTTTNTTVPHLTLEQPYKTDTPTRLWHGFGAALKGVGRGRGALTTIRGEEEETRDTTRTNDKPN